MANNVVINDDAYVSAVESGIFTGTYEQFSEMVGDAIVNADEEVVTSLGNVSAYLDAVAHGFNGTREEFGTLMAYAVGIPDQFARAFSESTAYEVGDYVLYNGILYRFTSDHAAGSWDASDVTQIVLSDEFDVFSEEKVDKSTTVNGHALSGNVEVDAGDIGFDDTETYDDGTVGDTLKDLLTDVGSLASGKVDKIQGKGLSTNDLTDALKEKLDGISSGAQVNVIETIKRNGTALTPTNKAVDISVPTQTSDLTNNSDFPSDANYVHTDNNFSAAYKSKLDGIEDQANKTIVDDGLSATSHHPVENHVVKEALDLKLNTSLKGAANGLAELDSGGRVPAAQLPSYVDDIIEGYYKAQDGKFYEEDTYTTEITPESGKIYVSVDTNISYRWGGSAYVKVASDLALGETSSTAYRGDRGATAYSDSQANKQNIGTLSSLETSAKTNIVDAINELESDKAEKSATVSNVSYDGSTRKLQKTINGTTTDVFTADAAPTDNSTNPVISGGVKSAIDGKEDVANKKTAWQGTPSDTAYPSEKLTKDSLDLKENSANKVSAFQTTPDDNHYPTEKLLKDSLDALPATATPQMDGAAAVGSSSKLAKEDHVHPTDTSRVPTSRTVNSKALSSDVTLSAEDLQYDSTLVSHTAGSVGEELDSQSRRIDGLDADDIAYSSSETYAAGTVGKELKDQSLATQGIMFPEQVISGSSWGADSTVTASGRSLTRHENTITGESVSSSSAYQEFLLFGDSTAIQSSGVVNDSETDTFDYVVKMHGALTIPNEFIANAKRLYLMMKYNIYQSDATSHNASWFRIGTIDSNQVVSSFRFAPAGTGGSSTGAKGIAAFNLNAKLPELITNKNIAIGMWSRHSRCVSNISVYLVANAPIV